jgi:hypothetical protein
MKAVSMRIRQVIKVTHCVPQSPYTCAHTRAHRLIHSLSHSDTLTHTHTRMHRLQRTRTHWNRRLPLTHMPVRVHICMAHYPTPAPVRTYIHGLTHTHVHCHVHTPKRIHTHSASAPRTITRKETVL